MKFNAFTNRDIQNAIQLLNHFEAGGVTDIRFVRQRLQDHINTNMVAARLVENKSTKRHIDHQTTCPSCGKQSLGPAASFDGLLRVACACGYSQLVIK